MKGCRVLVVDDDADIRTVLEGVYRRAGFDVDTAADGKAALRQLFDHRPDLIVLDLGLPGLDGLAVLERIRELTNLPVLVLTARGFDSDKVRAFSSGADDYLTKPYSNAELLARSIALLRRSTTSPATSDVIDDGVVRLDLDQRRAWVEGRQVSLTPTDWSLLLAFVQRPEHVLSVEKLLQLAWHDPLAIGPDRVKFAVLRLRRRLGWDDAATSRIQAVRGFGYRYRPGSLT